MERTDQPRDELSSDGTAIHETHPLNTSPDMVRNSPSPAGKRRARQRPRRTFRPGLGERSLTPTQVMELFGRFYNEDPGTFNGQARKFILRYRLGEIGVDDPCELVNQSVVVLAERAAAGTIYASGGPGLLMRQIEFTAHRFSDGARRGAHGKVRPGGLGSDGLDEALGAAIRRQAREMPDSRVGDLIAEDAVLDRLDEVREKLGSQLYRQLRTRPGWLTGRQYRALADCRDAHRGMPVTGATRAAAYRARAILWPWVRDRLQPLLGMSIEDSANRSVRLDAILDALGFFDDKFRRLFEPSATSAASRTVSRG